MEIEGIFEKCEIYIHGFLTKLNQFFFPFYLSSNPVHTFSLGTCCACEKLYICTFLI